MNNEIVNSTIDGVLNTKLHIQNIPPHITDVHLRSLLGNVGFIKDICYFNKSKKQMNNNNFANKKIYNTALVTFNTHEEALNVLKNIKNLIDTSGEERNIEAKFAVPNVSINNNNNNNNNNFFQKNNMNNTNFSQGSTNYGNNFNNENFQGNNNMNNYNFYNNGSSSNNNNNNNQTNTQNNFMNRNMKNKNMNNNNNNNNMMMNMNFNNQQMNNNPMLNQNNFMLNNNNNFNNSAKNLNDMYRDGEISPNHLNNNNNNMNNHNNNNNMNNNNNNNNNVMFRQNNSHLAHMYQANDNSLEDVENVDGLSLWEMYKDKNNNVFYYNNLTKHSQWHKPVHPSKLFQYNNNEKTKQNGPSGSNLFIFHIPSEWTDLDLFQHFCCFGNIISSKIQRDSTGRNSGFGFVSYDNVISAQHAIQFMNGYFVNNKYLKVQLKKGETVENAN
ncbi:clustered-asparagine-rich protein [Plasmodium sp. gorilla clade G2]|uniref:clustered-asparagine-rich protein n=1 Tax=Plasmodium sp. gorilla clade G2 TaxID=880535 RepID=UPI000D208D8B|nr:clustered-asparagine-rich protein [Plasmodium sp. gorilla clade G2]SOV17007.1 clustered-asparagine-rich protein [Plasmodium sp. gorilla clade G2]